jgi:hypothetical protein
LYTPVPRCVDDAVPDRYGDIGSLTEPVKLTFG